MNNNEYVVNKEEIKKKLEDIQDLLDSFKIRRVYYINSDNYIELKDWDFIENFGTIWLYDEELDAIIEFILVNVNGKQKIKRVEVKIPRYLPKEEFKSLIHEVMEKYNVPKRYMIQVSVVSPEGFKLLKEQFLERKNKLLKFYNELLEEKKELEEKLKEL